MSTITTLIPAYRKQFLADTLLGLARQTYRDFRVIISDDSPGDEIMQLIRMGHFGDLTKTFDLQIVRGSKNTRLNQQALLDLWAESSPYVHIQLDGDVIFPEFYCSHMAAHQAGSFSVSISRRWTSDDDTRPTRGIDLPSIVEASPLMHVPLSAKALFQTMVPACDNWIGESSNMVMSAVGARAYPKPPIDDLSYYGSLDVGFVLTAVQQAPVVVLRDHLGAFRQHAGQNTHHLHPPVGRLESMAWATTALLAWREGHISPADAFTVLARNAHECLGYFGEEDPVINEFFDLIQTHSGNLEHLYAAYKPFWLWVIASERAAVPAN